MVKKKKNRYKSDRNRKLLMGFAKAGVGMASVVLVTIALSAVFAHSYYALMDAPWPRIKDIEMIGLDHLDRKQVLDALGVARNVNYFSVKTPELARRLESIPWVQTAVVRLELSGRLVVEIIERKPIALIHRGEFWLIDEEGKLFAQVRPQDYSDLVLVTGYDESDFLRGQVLLPRKMDILRELLSAFKRARSWLPTYFISECRWSKHRGFVLYTTEGGVPIRLGFERFPEKLDRLKTVLEVLGDRGCLDDVTGIDLDYSKRAFVEGNFTHSKNL